MYYNVTSPAGVVNAIMNDFKDRGITLSDASQMMSYRNRQSLTNLLSHIKKTDSYMTKKQAKRFVDVFGYNSLFLEHGWSTLKADDDQAWNDISKLSFVTILPNGVTKKVLDSNELEKADIIELLWAASEIIDATRMPDTIMCWRALLEGDKDSFNKAVAETRERLIRQDNYPLHPHVYSGHHGYAYLQLIGKLSASEWPEE